MSTNTVQQMAETIEQQARAARRSTGVARAWQLGHRLADLITEHDVPRPDKVWTNHYPDGLDGEGQTHLAVRMASAADLIRLANRAGAPLHTCPTSEYSGGEQAYIDLGYGLRRQIAVWWVGLVSTAERAS